MSKLSISEHPSNSNAFYMIIYLEDKLKRSLNKLVGKYHGGPTKISFKREDGTPKKGDYSVYLPNVILKTENLEEIIENLRSEMGEEFGSCNADPISRLTVRLNRHSIYISTLRQVLSCKSDYGTSSIGQNISAVIIPHFSDVSSLNNLRTQFTTQHVALILIANGYKVFLPKNSSLFNDTTSENLAFYNCSEHCDIDTVSQEKLHLAENSKWRLDLKNIKRGPGESTSSDNDLLILDGRQYLNEHSLRSYFSRNIGYLYVKRNGDLTDVFKKCVLIKHMQKHTNGTTILHVVPENKACVIQQSAVLSEMLDDTFTKQHYLVHQRTLCKSSGEIDKENYFKKKYDDMRNSLVHKYGPDVEKDEMWKTCIENLTKTVVTFDFLHSRYSMPLKIDFLATSGEVNEKGGAFVQYNCARLSMLFKHFEARVKDGFYQALPDFEEVDFTLLTQDDEWSLFYGYVLPFPSLIRELVTNSLSSECDISNISTHTIPQMLVKLSRDLSIYYNKTRILVDPYPQLQKRMFARLYFLQSVHQVMKCALALLNLPVVDRM